MESGERKAYDTKIDGESDEARILHNDRFLRISCRLLLVVEGFMILVYFLSHIEGKPELEMEYLVFYAVAVAVALVMLAVSYVVRRHHKSTTCLQYTLVNFVLLWGVIFSCYDVWRGNSGAALSQMMLFTSFGFYFPRQIHFIINIGYWVFYILMLLTAHLPQQRFYSEAINSGIYLLLACSMIYVAARFQDDRARAIKQILRLQNDNLDMIVAQVDKIQTVAEDTRILRHDLRHIAFSVRENAQRQNYRAIMEIAEEILKKTGRPESLRTIRTYTGAPEIDAALAMCEEWAEREEVNLIISVQRPREINIRDFSLILLNALENARIAVDEQRTGERSLEVTGEIRGQQYYLSVINSYEPGSATINPRTGIPVAREKNHGYGTKSIARIIEKYQGYYRFQAKEKFRFQALLTMRKEQ